jgi:hypothetical protein
MDQAVKLVSDLGDQAGEASFTYTSAILQYKLERNEEALATVRRALDLAVQTEHPDLPDMQEFHSHLEQTARDAAAGM